MFLGHWLAALILLALLLSAIRAGNRASSRRRGLELALTTVFSATILFLLSAANPVRLGRKTDCNLIQGRIGENNRLAEDLLKAENQKAIEEIRLLMEHEEDWFHKKFLLVGGLLVALLTHLGVESFKVRQVGQENQAETVAEERVLAIFDSGATCLVLALACVIALAIDVHVKSNIMVVEQLGEWLARSVERMAVTKTADTTVVFWEQFLRNPNSDPRLDSCSGSTKELKQNNGGMHSDDLYSLSYYPHLNFLTGLLYCLFLASLQRFSHAEKNHRQAGLAELALLGFALVHIAMAIFVWVGHSLPDSFEIKLLPYSDIWWPSIEVIPFYLFLWSLLVIVSLPCLLRIHRIARQRQGRGEMIA